MSITFRVSEVERAGQPLARPEGGPVELPVGPAEACGSNHDTVRPCSRHALLETVGLAFAEHYPLVLTPDVIWLAIAQGFATHVRANAERLRGKFVRHEGKERLRVRRDDFVKGSPANPWPEVFAEFSGAIAERIGRQRDLVVCDFSTTGGCERAASEIVLMDAMEPYFGYEMFTLCGIPEITLAGTVDDWQSIRTRAQALREYELGWWVAALTPVLNAFVAAADGHVDVPFWRSFLKVNDDSGGPYVTGWINVLFPYLRGEENEGVRRNRSATKWAEDLDAGLQSGLPESSVPAGVSCVSFEWQYLGEIFPMEFAAGFFGLSQDPSSLALEPAIGWAVQDARPTPHETP